MHHLIIGLGEIANAHATLLKALGERVSFFSRDAEKAAAYQRRLGGEAAFADLAAALGRADIESCVIAVPHHLHEHYAAAAVSALKHVLLEKPIAHTMESAERIARLSGESGSARAFMIAEQMDYVPVAAHLKRLAAAAPPIRYQFRDHNTFRPTGWRTDLASAGGGVMLDLGIHYVSLAVNAFGPIASAGRHIDRTLAETGVPLAERLSIRHANGIEGEVSVAWAEPQSDALLAVTTAGSTFTYRPWRRVAMRGAMPQWVALRSTDGRRPMMAEYLARCRGARPSHSVRDALPALAAVLGGAGR